MVKEEETAQTAEAIWGDFKKFIVAQEKETHGLVNGKHLELLPLDRFRSLTRKFLEQAGVYALYAGSQTDLIVAISDWERGITVTSHPCLYETEFCNRLMNNSIGRQSFYKARINFISEIDDRSLLPILAKYISVNDVTNLLPRALVECRDRFKIMAAVAQIPPTSEIYIAGGLFLDHEDAVDLSAKVIDWGQRLNIVSKFNLALGKKQGMIISSRDSRFSGPVTFFTPDLTSISQL